MLNQLCDKVAEHRLAMGHCPVEAAKVLSVMHAAILLSVGLRVRRWWSGESDALCGQRFRGECRIRHKP